MLALILNYGSEYIDPSAADMSAEPTLIRVLGNRSWTPDIIKKLLDIGCDATATNDRGMSCLQYALRGSLSLDSPAEIEETLVLLLKAGANPYHKDNDGMTPSHFACDGFTELLCGTTSYSCNCDLQAFQLWTKALETCGYDARELVKESLAATPSFQTGRCDRCFWQWLKGERDFWLCDWGECDCGVPPCSRFSLREEAENDGFEYDDLSVRSDRSDLSDAELDSDHPNFEPMLNESSTGDRRSTKI